VFGGRWEIIARRHSGGRVQSVGAQGMLARAMAGLSDGIGGSIHVTGHVFTPQNTNATDEKCSKARTT
jgi:hypothetical protein